MTPHHRTISRGFRQARQMLGIRLPCVPIRSNNRQFRLRECGAKPRRCRTTRVARLVAGAVARQRRAPASSRGLSAARHPQCTSPELTAELDGLARICSEHAGNDGRHACLVELADGQTVESVLLPRDGVCVSTQVGCAVGCLFCMTGRDGLCARSAAPRSSPRWFWRAAVGR